MTNAERKAALAEARSKAVAHARASEVAGSIGMIENHIMRATMWAALAEAMKDGDPSHDAPDGAPSLPLLQGELTTLADTLRKA